MGWHGTLDLRYRVDRPRLAADENGDTPPARTIVHDRHDGPLRVLASLYPEAPSVCHNVLVHPPGGIVGGDELHLTATLAEGAHALVTTPGATRFYRSAGDGAVQALTARLDGGARLEWLPLETIAYSGCLAANRLRFELAPGAEVIGWDVLALGLPASGQPFERGRYAQTIELAGSWLEHGVIDAADRRLLDSPLGFAGRRVAATLWFAAGSPLAPARRDALLDAARTAAQGHPLGDCAGSTSPQPEVVLLRVLAHRVEPALGLLTEVWRAWRREAWSLAACAPRVWRT
jgi:urease accessory protein